jgi:ABC-type multidrug transport system fused ATPase/permease subunit
MFYYIASMIALESLSLYFPILLQEVTRVAQAQFDGGRNVAPLLLQGFLVILFIALIFVVQFISEYCGVNYMTKYQANIRKALHDKYARLSPDQIDKIGVARMLPTIMNDTIWLRDYHRRKVIMLVYFPVAILGSFIMLFTLNLYYALFAFASLPILFFFFFLMERRLHKIMPESVDGYDEHFMNIKEGIKGMREIRILGKADERTADFEKYVRANRGQKFLTQFATGLSTGVTAIVFSLITVAIIIFAVAFKLSPAETAGLVALNTAIQYINKLSTGSHQIIVWFVAHIPRCRYTFQRFDKIYALPDQIAEDGLTQIPAYKGNNIRLNDVVYKLPNGKTEINNININIRDAGIVAIAGGVESGKSTIADMLIKAKKPTSGTIKYNEIDIGQLNTAFWRREYLSVCVGSPKFIPGTVRDNMKLFDPNITDTQIIDLFREIVSPDFMSKFENILEFRIHENTTEGTKNIFNIIRMLIKPAQIYIFNQCFEHVKQEYVTAIIAKLRREKRTAVFVTYDDTVCRGCDNIYVLANGRICGSGTHMQLLKTNAPYRELHASSLGNILYEEEKEKEHPSENPNGNIAGGAIPPVATPATDAPPSYAEVQL